MKLLEKKRKKTYSSMTVTTGDPAYNIAQFNKHAGTDFASPDGANTPALDSGYMAGGEGGSEGGLSESVLDEATFYASKLKQNIECPNHIRVISQSQVEDAIRKLDPEEPFEIGYITPVYFYKDLWDKFMLVKCTEFSGYTGIDYRDVRSRENTDAERDARKLLSAEQTKSGDKEIRTLSHTWQGKQYRDINKTVDRGEADIKNDAGITTHAKLNTLMYFPDPEKMPKVTYYIDLHDGKGYFEVPRDILERTIFAKVKELANTKVKDADLSDKIHKVLAADKATTGTEKLADKLEKEYTVNGAVYKPTVRQLYTNQVYFLQSEVKDADGKTARIRLGSKLNESLTEEATEDYDFYDWMLM